MAPANTLREYLVSLGFKINDQQYKKFKDNLAQTTKRFEELGSIAAGAATALTVSVAAITKNMDKLYYASIRIGDSASHVRSFAFAATQIGVSADGATAALEGMQQAMRSNPGLRGLLAQLHVDPDQKGTKTFVDLIDKLRRMPHPNDINVGALYGIDPTTLFQFEKNFDEFKTTMANADAESVLNADKMAKFHKFSQDINALEFRFESLAIVVAERFLPAMERALTVVEEIIGFLIKADDATDGWSTKLVGVVTALGGVVGSLGALKAVSGLLGIGGATAGAETGATAAGTTAAVAGGGGLLTAMSTAVPGVLGGLLSKEALDTLAYKWQTGADSEMSYQHTLNRAIMSKNGGFHNPGNLRSWGDTPTAERFRGKVSIGNFAKFGSDQEGLSAMAGNLLAYGRGGTNTIDSIVSRWAPSSENNTSAYINDIAGKLGIKSNVALNLNDPVVMRNLMAAMIAHEGSGKFSTAAIDSAVGSRLGQEAQRGGGAVTLNQKTDIHIDGSGDPKQVGSQVLRQQQRTNSDAIRYLAGAVDNG